MHTDISALRASADVRRCLYHFAMVAKMRLGKLVVHDERIARPANLKSKRP